MNRHFPLCHAPTSHTSESPKPPCKGVIHTVTIATSQYNAMDWKYDTNPDLIEEMSFLGNTNVPIVKKKCPLLSSVNVGLNPLGTIKKEIQFGFFIWTHMNPFPQTKYLFQCCQWDISGIGQLIFFVHTTCYSTGKVFLAAEVCSCVMAFQQEMQLWVIPPTTDYTQRLK